MTQQKVFLYDALHLTRRGWENILESTSDFVLEFTSDSLTALTAELGHKNCDVLIVNCQHKEYLSSTVQDLTNLINAERIVLMANLSSKEEVDTLLGDKFRILLTRHCDQGEISGALKAAVQGKRFFSNQILELLLDEDKLKHGIRINELSDREQQILGLIAQGKKTNEIAEALFISVHTVNSHRTNILKKLQLKSPAQLVLYAAENGLIATPHSRRNR